MSTVGLISVMVMWSGNRLQGEHKKNARDLLATFLSVGLPGDVKFFVCAKGAGREAHEFRADRHLHGGRHGPDRRRQHDRDGECGGKVPRPGEGVGQDLA